MTKPAIPVNIGYGSALDYWHRAANPAYMRFKETPTQENAIECAQAIEDLRGWHWSDTHPGIDPRAASADYDAFNRSLFAACPDLPLIKDIAELAKHGGQLSRADVQVKEIRGAGAGGIMQESGPLGTFEHKPVCTLTAALRDGFERPIPEMLARANLYWRDILIS